MSIKDEDIKFEDAIKRYFHLYRKCKYLEADGLNTKLERDTKNELKHQECTLRRAIIRDWKKCWGLEHLEGYMIHDEMKKLGYCVAELEEESHDRCKHDWCNHCKKNRPKDECPGWCNKCERDCHWPRKNE